MSRPIIGLVVIDPNARGLAAEVVQPRLRAPLRLRANDAAVIERLKLCVTLCHNLAIAGALTYSFVLGVAWGADYDRSRRRGAFPTAWHPNPEGTPAP